MGTLSQITVLSVMHTQTYHHPSAFPEPVWAALSQNDIPGNIILPFAQKASSLPSEQLWIALFADNNNVAYMLSCTTGPLGKYPIFIVACEPAKEEVDLTDAMSALVRCLLDGIQSPQRVFAIFSAENVTKAFAKAFETHAPAKYGIKAIEKPYYEAVLASCTIGTFVEDLMSQFPNGEDIEISLRRADMSHLQGVKHLCQKFSEDQAPYVLGDKGAELEAKTMIENEQAWIHIVQRVGQEEEIACLVATTRASDNVTAVTKVFTPLEWRSKGCAKRLLHRVCHSIFSDQKDKTIMLYVSTSKDFLPARKIYKRIGFAGLEGLVNEQGLDNEQAVTNKWLETGFEGTTLGYW